MRGNELLEKMALIDPQYVEAADSSPARRPRHFARRIACVAACLCLAFTLAVPAMAASIPAFYELMYAISPAAAQFFKPVQISCEDNGIRMTVEAVRIYGNTAEIYITLRDLEQQRLDETVDLFDSYRILSPFPSTGTCQLWHFSPEEQTATFLITIRQWEDKPIAGEKLTFLLREFLSKKTVHSGILNSINREDVNPSPDVQVVRPRGLGGPPIIDAYMAAGGKSITVLKPSDTPLTLDDGVSLTGIGIVDGNLHVQVYYENILRTDNHGSIGLINRETMETRRCDGSAAFFDAEGTGSYEDYIFLGCGPEILDSYALYGDFVTSNGSVAGNWSVTFPLENRG